MMPLTLQISCQLRPTVVSICPRDKKPEIYFDKINVLEKLLMTLAQRYSFLEHSSVEEPHEGMETEGKMNAYDKLVQQRRRQEKLDIKQLTHDVLYQLWWDEDCSDSTIAELFQVKTKKITNLRTKWGMKVEENIVNEVASRFEGWIPTIDADKRVSTLSKEAITLLRKISGLNDIELESLRVALARRFPAFAEMKLENDFVQAVERVIRQFGNQK